MPAEKSVAPMGQLPGVSSSFRKEAIRSVIAIIAFIIVYFLLFLFALCLVALCFYLAFLLISASMAWLPLFAGIGLVGCGVMVFVFLIKFLFSSSKAEENDCIEVTESEQPVLLESIRSLSKQIGTPMPKKVFLSSEVNASVSYNSSFWSTFLPVKKNLRIGMGLVNSLNVSELEAVLAHEFGHFSQRSMKVGSWVYQVNKIIYDMLANNAGFNTGLVKWAEVSWIFMIFSKITLWIIKGIQWVLHQMYKVVNKNYKSLSRQMEFHADLVAASVRGSNNMVHALLRVDFADTAFNQTIDACNKAWMQKKVPRDFFAAHSFILQHVGQQNQLGFEGNLPVINHHQESNFSRVNFKDQWSSHPTFTERKENLENYGHNLIPDTRSAWTLFQNIHELRTQLTGIVYRDIPKDEIDSSLDDHQFESLIQQDIKNDSFPDFYNGYYDYRRVEVFNVEDVLQEQSSFMTLKEVFNEQVMGLPKKLRFLRNDIAVLQDIEARNIDANTFDFDGEKYKRKDASRVITQLQEELARLEDELVKSDKSLFKYFYTNASECLADELKQEYSHYFNERLEADVFFKTVSEMMEPLWPVYRGEKVTIENALSMIKEHKDVLEPQFKEQLRNWIPRFTTNQDLKSSIEKFLATDYQYFHEDSFFDNELQDLHRLMSDCLDEVNEYLFVNFRRISEKQMEISGK